MGVGKKMIIGDGDIASILPERPGFCFFASGVSNSGETRESEYQREKDMMLLQDKKWHIVYFSSLGALDGDTRYYRHKKEMEELVKTFDTYTIVRIGNITWGKNPNTLINSMRLRLKKGEKLEIRDEYRYLADKDEFLYWVKLLPEWSCEISIPGKRMKIKDMVKEYVL